MSIYKGLWQTGDLFAITGEGFRRTWDIRHWWREYIRQVWFLAKVTTLPSMLIAVPFGGTIALQLGDLTRQLGAQSATGSVVMAGLVSQVAPMVAALLISGAGGSAISSDMGARNIRDELAAMEVMAVNPVHRLVTPRLWAAGTVGVMLVSFVILAGVLGGFYFNVLVQGISPGAYLGGATLLLQIADLYVALFKAFLFGIIAAGVSCHKGMNCERSPVGVGLAVKQAVVTTFVLIFFVNYIVTTLYFAIIPPKLAF